MPKKHMPGFVPIPFKSAGKIIFPISLVLVTIGGLDYLFGMDLIPLSVFLLGLGLFIISLYLLFIVPEE